MDGCIHQSKQEGRGLAVTPSTKMKEKVLTHASVSKLLWVIPFAALILLYLIFSSTKPKQVILLHADQDSVAKASSYLYANHIAHSIMDGNIILVDEDIRAQTIITLASENLLSMNNSNGFELFDEFSFGMTE